MDRSSIRSLKWEYRYATIFKCFNKPNQSGEKDVAELLVASADDIKQNPNLDRVLGVLQRELIFKRIYHHANNPTSRLLPFRANKDKGNQGQKLLNLLRISRNKEEVREQSLKLAQKYVELPGVREGILIFILLRGKSNENIAENCIFVIKCDFEAVSKIAPEVLFQRIEDAIVEKTKKGALYPYFERREFDYNTVRIFDELGETQYWLDFLELGERLADYVSFQKIVIENLPEQVVKEYIEEFKELPAVRSLAQDDRLIKEKDRIPFDEIEGINDAITKQAGERKITLNLGEVKVTAPLSQFGKTWTIAEEGKQRYILIKGSQLKNRTAMLTPIDLAKLDSLQEAKARLGI